MWQRKEVQELLRQVRKLNRSTEGKEAAPHVRNHEAHMPMKSTVGWPYPQRLTRRNRTAFTIPLILNWLAAAPKYPSMPEKTSMPKNPSAAPPWPAPARKDKNCKILPLKP
jgi:hypothetical protein